MKRRSIARYFFQLWDIGGSAIQGKMLDKYVFGADAILFVYDVTNLNRFSKFQSTG